MAKEKFLVKVGYSISIAFDSPEDAASFTRSLLRGKLVDDTYINGDNVVCLTDNPRIAAEMKQALVFESRSEAQESTNKNITYWVNRKKFVSASGSNYNGAFRKETSVPDDHDLYVIREGITDDELVKNDPYTSITLKDGMQFYSAPKHI